MIDFSKFGGELPSLTALTITSNMAQVPAPSYTLPNNTALSGGIPATLPVSGWHWVKRSDGSWAQSPNSSSVTLTSPAINPGNGLPFALAYPGYHWIRSNGSSTLWVQASASMASAAQHASVAVLPGNPISKPVMISPGVMTNKLPSMALPSLTSTVLHPAVVPVTFFDKAKAFVIKYWWVILLALVAYFYLFGSKKRRRF